MAAAGSCEIWVEVHAEYVSATFVAADARGEGAGAPNEGEAADEGDARRVAAGERDAVREAAGVREGVRYFLF